MPCVECIFIYQTDLQCIVSQCNVLHYSTHHWTQLHFTALHCTELNSTALNCTALHWTKLHCTEINCTALNCTALNCTEQNCTSLNCTAVHWTKPHCTEIKCSVLKWRPVKICPVSLAGIGMCRSSSDRAGQPQPAHYRLDITTAHWDIVWKSRGGIMVNGVPWEVSRPKPEGPQAAMVFGCGTSRGTQFTIIPPRLFNIMSFFWHPGLVKRDFFQPMDCIRLPMVNFCPALDKHCSS